MVNAADLKSAVAKAAYGFESRPRHPGSYDGIRLPKYAPGSTVRRVNRNGCVRYHGRMVFVSESVSGYDVAVRASRLYLASAAWRRRRGRS